ncbi:PaaI family thioesterase [Mycolicibacterium phlei]|uniref:PaaI family thioesterase n=1 Tax=Mycolicibacterium phlei TaxID=1771 RepID=UPI0037C60C76
MGTDSTSDVTTHPGGGFAAIVPTDAGGPDYGRFIEAMRTLQDHARAANAPDEVISQAADMVERVSALLEPYYADEWTSPSGRRTDLPNRGNLLSIPLDVRVTDDNRIVGAARFRRFHLGRNGAAHGGTIAQLFDALLGHTAFTLSGAGAQRTAFLHVDYRKIAEIGKELSVEGTLDKIEGRKIFVSGRVHDGEDLVAEGHALFLKLKPGQP